MAPPTSSSTRRFHPEPIETSSRHSDARNGAQEQTQATTNQNRHPTPQPDAKAMPNNVKTSKVESAGATQKTNRAAIHDNAGDESDVPLLPHERAVNNSTPHSHSPARRKFAVEPLETTSRSNRKDNADSTTTSHSATPTSHSPTRSTEAPKPAPGRRKFKVEMIETAKRSRRSGDTGPAVRPEDKTNGLHSESFKTLPPAPPPVAPTNTPTSSINDLPISQLLKPIPNRQGSMHPHHTTRTNTRTHSFKVPSLEAIDSSESSPGASDSSTTSRSSSEDQGYKDATRMRESVDDRFSGYLLTLAARAAEKQLREQETAIFPAPDVHEPIMHYVDSEGSSPVASPKPTTHAKSAATPYRRDSADEDLAIKEMQKHGQEVLQKVREEERLHPRKTGAFNVEFDGEAAQGAWMTPAKVNPANVRSIHQHEKAPKANNLIGGYQRDPDLRQMRKAASPPMLGGNLDFPRCPSPEHARFDVTQGSEFLRTNMTYLNANGAEPNQGLWGRSDTKSSVKSSETNKSAGGGGGGGGGLWGGHCTNSDAKLMAAPMGIVTPRRTPTYEKDDPFQSLASGVAAGTSVAGTKRAPPSPPPSNTSNVSLTAAANHAAQEVILEREFPDMFVTQVYNYLSLGFPALARKFDPELSKISGIHVEKLQRDDKLAEARGYLRLGENEVDVPKRPVQANGNQEDMPMANADEEGVEPVHEEMCARWRALRIYVREWGRQMGVADDAGDQRRFDPHRAWGVPARKGSWAG